MNSMLICTMIFVSHAIGVESNVVYNNPNNQKVLSVAKKDEFVVSWNLDIKDKGYMYSRMILRHKTHTTAICKFDHDELLIYDSEYQKNIMDIQRTQIKLVSISFELDEVLFSIENSYRVNETTTNVDVYDFIPIFVIAKPNITCQDNQQFVDNTLIIECSIRSKPEADINVGFQMMHSGLNTTKTNKIDSYGFSTVNLIIRFSLHVNYLNKKLFVSASVGKFHEVINVSISSKLPPFNVKLFVDEDNSPERNLSVYSLDQSKIVVRCSADSFSGQLQYTIKAPNRKTFNEEQYVIDKFKESDHAGTWECSVKNGYGTVKSPPVTVRISEEKPSIPVIKINNIVNSTNSFCVDFLDVITVSCLVIHNNPLYDNQTIRYTLQMINRGSKYNKTTNENGSFDIVFDESYHENIYACRAENDIGVGSPAIFYLYKNIVLEESTINFMKTIEIHSTYKEVTCCLTALLVFLVVILIMKLRHRTNRMHLCGGCYGYPNENDLNNPTSSEVLTRNLESYTEAERNKEETDSFVLADHSNSGNLPENTKNRETLNPTFVPTNPLRENNDETTPLL